MKSFLNHFLQQNNLLFLLLIGMDVLVLLLHLVIGERTSFFHLDFEQNLPTYYQSLKLIGFGSFCLIVGLSKSISWGVKSFVMPLAVFLIFLGIDELFQVHENIYRIFDLVEALNPSKIVEVSMRLGYRSSLWILYYLPLVILFGFWSGYWLRYFQSKMKSHARILLLSSGCLFAVLLAEILSSTGTYSPDTYFWLVTIEETAEMLLASSLVIVGIKMLSKQF